MTRKASTRNLAATSSRISRCWGCWHQPQPMNDHNVPRPSGHEVLPGRVEKGCRAHLPLALLVCYSLGFGMTTSSPCMIRSPLYIQARASRKYQPLACHSPSTPWRPTRLPRPLVTRLSLSACKDITWQACVKRLWPQQQNT
jgi:hypothetical protein